MTDQRIPARPSLHDQAADRVLRPAADPSPGLVSVVRIPGAGQVRGAHLVQALWNRCDGSPGNPGVETIATEDGPDKVACLGCPVCRINGVRDRIARTGDVLLGAGAPADVDEEF